MWPRFLVLAVIFPAAILLGACESQLKGGAGDAAALDSMTSDAGQTRDSSGQDSVSSPDRGSPVDSSQDRTVVDRGPLLPDSAPTPDHSAVPDVVPAPDAARPDLPVSDQGPLASSASVIYLHHSTGGEIWSGGVPGWLQSYNQTQGTSYSITEQAFPKASPYGWENYPYDYWNIWVNHAGTQPYLTEPTLELLTAQYDVIVFKHCFPVSGILEDTGSPDVASSAKRVENYMLQYTALKQKLRAFPDTRFLVWTGAALTAAASSVAEGTRARAFFTWVKETWDEPGDNIFVWDFYELETEGGLFLLDAYAASTSDSHPNSTFSSMAAPLFGQRLVDVIEGRGDSGSLTGQ